MAARATASRAHSKVVRSRLRFRLSELFDEPSFLASLASDPLEDSEDGLRAFAEAGFRALVAGAFLRVPDDEVLEVDFPVGVIRGSYRVPRPKRRGTPGPPTWQGRRRRS